MLNIPHLVGATGLAGVGKDTLSDHLVEKFHFTKHSLADPIKRALNAMFGFTPAQWLDREWKERELPGIGRSPRYLAQTLGTEWGRNQVKSDLWLSLAEALWCDMNHDAAETFGPYGLVIPDIRFPNEAAWLRAQGGVLVHVKRPGVASVNAHVSESGIPFVAGDVVVENAGDIPTFLRNAERVLAASDPGTLVFLEGPHQELLW